MKAKKKINVYCTKAAYVESLQDDLNNWLNKHDDITVKDIKVNGIDSIYFGMIIYEKFVQ